MNEPTLEKISSELASALTGQRFGKIFPLSRFRMAIDFRLSGMLFLLISVEPSAPRIYLIKRSLRDLEKKSVNQNSFILFLKKRLSNAVLQAVEKFPGERILRFVFLAASEIGQSDKYSLIVQLTGRSANLFLLDKNNVVLEKMRETFGEGQEFGDVYAPPRKDGEKVKKEVGENFPLGKFETLSAALDNFYLEKEAEKIFQNRAQSAENKLKREIVKRKKLARKLNEDLANHGEAENWKRSGDLILANLATAKREKDKIFVTDFYDENLPEIAIEADENLSLTEAAEKFFRRYTKARNALAEITKRLADLESQLADLEFQKQQVENAVAERDEQFLIEFLNEKEVQPAVRQKFKKPDNFTGARRFVSSDGFEILVGKGAKDNDFLTFRVARSLDLWLHAADYPGSHVVIRNPNRQEIPPRTLLEAAQIAAFYSQAREQTKAAVHYTSRKFVNKPKGAALGLVSLSSFKTILVEPKIGER